MSADQRLREILARDADSFRPDIERSLQMAMRTTQHRRRRLGWMVTAAVVAILIAGVAIWPWGGERALVADTARHQHTGRWMTMPAAPLSARHDAVGAWVDRRFVIVGGSDTMICGKGGSCAPALTGPRPVAFRDGATFDPADQTWQPIAEAPTPISSATTAVVNDQLYLLTQAPGSPGEPSHFVRYDPETDRWAELPAPPQPELTLVSAGRFVVALSSTDERGAGSDAVYNPTDRSWHQLPPDPLGPSFDRMAVWTGTALLLTGKELIGSPGAYEPANPAVVRLAELDGSNQQQHWPGMNFEAWTRLPDTDILGYQPVAVSDRIVWPDPGSANGGGHWNRSYDFGGIYDPASKIWQPLPKPPAGKGLTLPSDSEFSPLAVGDQVVVGGHLLDPVTRTWQNAPTFPDPKRQAAAVLSGPDTILVWGGGTQAANVASGYLLKF